jgi:molybdopterin/thiamine biosynthesis adenylyltransferase
MTGADRDRNSPATVLFPGIEEHLDQRDTAALLTGHSRDDRSIWQVTGTAEIGEEAKIHSSESHDNLIGLYLPEASVDDFTEVPSEYPLEDAPQSFKHPHLLVTSDSGGLESKRWVDDSGERLPIESVDLNDRLMIRLEDGPTPLGELRDKKVAIVGVGSGGALVAEYLAKSGVENLVLVDDDLYETHNIVRHICGMDALGRKKVNAVKSHIKDRLPNVSIDAVDSKFKWETRESIELFKSKLEDVDLIVAAAGEHSTNNLLETFVFNRLEHTPPVIYAGMFPDLDGGIMIRVDPEENDRCYHCIYSGGSLGGRPDEDEDEGDKKESAPRPQGADEDIPYDRTLEDERSQPGLGIDVDNLTIFTTKLALQTLLKDTDHGLYEFQQSVYTWANREMRRVPFNPENPTVALNPLELAYPPKDRLPQRDECPNCGE